MMRILFFVVALTILGLATSFLYVRLVRDTMARPLWRRVAAVFLAAPFLGAPLLRLVMGHGLFARGMATVVLAWWGVLLYALLTLMVVEVLRRLRPRPVDPERRRFLARASALGALGMGGGVGSLGLYRAMTEAEVTEVPIRLAGLPRQLDGLTLVQLSDLHIGPILQERFVDQLVGQVNRLRPDVIAITGDLVDGTPEVLERFVARLARLHSRYGTFVVSGNHDYYSGWEAWVPVHRRLGFQVLRNQRVSIGDAASFDLFGVDDWGRHVDAGDQRPYDLEAALAGRDPARGSVLLAHQPSNLEAVDAAGLGLQLSGHTHGGQLFPGTLIADLAWGTAAAGLSRHGSLWQYTHRGCGFVGPPMRVGSPPEVARITLLPA